MWSTWKVGTTHCLYLIRVGARAGKVQKGKLELLNENTLNKNVSNGGLIG